MGDVPNKAERCTVTVILKIKGICSVSLRKNYSVSCIAVCCYTVNGLAKSLTAKGTVYLFCQIKDLEFRVSCASHNSLAFVIYNKYYCD